MHWLSIVAAAVGFLAAKYVEYGLFCAVRRIDPPRATLWSTLGLLLVVVAVAVPIFALLVSPAKWGVMSVWEFVLALLLGRVLVRVAFPARWAASLDWAREREFEKARQV